MSEERISELQARVADLEAKVARLESGAQAAPATPATPVVRVTKPVVLSPEMFAAYQPAAPPRPSLNLEAFFGGRVLLGAGVTVFLAGVAFFLKYAFDNGWIGPTGRVTIGLLCGIALIAGSEWLHRSGQKQFAQAISGLGAAVMYLSLWAAGSYFHLVPLGATFVAMIAVTVCVIAVAIHRDARELAFVALAGGFATPALNAGGPPNLVMLFGYLALLDLAILLLTDKRWYGLEIFAFIGTQVYLFAQIPLNALPHRWAFNDGVILTFASVFWLQFSGALFVRTKRPAQIRQFEALLFIVTGAALYAVFYVELYDSHRLALTSAFLAIAAIYLYGARVSAGLMRRLCAAAALVFLTGCLAVTFKSNMLTASLAIEGAVLLVAGIKAQSPLLRGFGYAAYAFAMLSSAGDSSGDALFFNARFVTLLLCAATTAAVAYFAQDANFGELEQYLSPVFEAVSHVLILTAVAFEMDTAFHSPLGISIWLLAYALGLIAVGFTLKRSFTRWEGLALFAALLIKVFTIDLAAYDAIVRIVSFLAVGSVLLVVAFLYQRARIRTGDA